jgi:hypothetical protein
VNPPREVRGESPQPVTVTILAHRRSGATTDARTAFIGTYRISVPVTERQTIELEDDTVVVILGIRDVVPASGHPGWDQVVFVGTYEELLDPSTPTITFGHAHEQATLFS